MFSQPAKRSESRTNQWTVESPDRGCPLTEERKFQLLKNSRRRQIIDYLLEHEGPTTRSELAEIVAANENDIPVSELGSDQRKRVYVSMYQTHLPTLGDADVIQYDPNRGTVAVGPNLPELVPYLRTSDDADESTWNRHLLLLSVVAGGLFVALKLGGLTMSWLSDLWAVTFVSAVFLWSAYQLKT